MFRAYIAEAAAGIVDARFAAPTIVTPFSVTTVSPGCEPATLPPSALAPAGSALRSRNANWSAVNVPTGHAYPARRYCVRSSWSPRPITSTVRFPLNPVQVLLPANEQTGIVVTSVALLNQIRAIDRVRLIKRLGWVNDETMEFVDEAIRISLGLIEL